MWLGRSRALIARGLAAVAFGILLIGWPSISLTVLVLLFGAFALVDGSLIVALGLLMPSGAPTRALTLLGGVLAMAVGIATFFWPGRTELVLLVLIALRALMSGVAELAAAVWLGRRASAGWLLAAVGIVSIAFGALLLVYPAPGLVALVWAMGCYAFVLGVLNVARGWLAAMARYV